MLREALGVPLAGDDAATALVVGGLLGFSMAAITAIGLVGSIFVVGLFLLPLVWIPRLLLSGYLLRVLAATTHGEHEAPAFDDWIDLLVDGIRVFVVRFAYGIPVAFAFLAFLATLMFAGYSLPTESVATDDAVAAAALPGGEWLLVAVAGGFLLLVWSLVAYLRPIALANLAYEDALEAAFAVRRLSHVGRSWTFAIAWVAAAVIGGVGWLVGAPLTVLLVGFVVLFYARVVSFALYGIAFAERIDDGGANRASESAAGNRGVQRP